MVIKTSYCRYCQRLTQDDVCEITKTAVLPRELDEPGACPFYDQKPAAPTEEAGK